MNMKTKFYLVLILITLVSTFRSNGQDIIPGLKFGMNLSKLSCDQFESTPRIGIDVGITFSTLVSDNFDILSEFSFAQKGGRVRGRTYSGSTFGELADYNLFMNSYNWNLLGNYYLKAPNFSIQAGPSIGFMNSMRGEDLSGEIFLGSSNKIEENINAYDLCEAIDRKNDFSLVLGVSGGTEALRVNIRYHHGFTNYYKSIDKGLGYNVKNKFLQISITYIFTTVRVVSF